MTRLVFKALFPFGGLGAGARGFLDAATHLFGRELAFECLGGIDNDAEACADFEYLTGSSAWHTSVEDISPEALRLRYGELAPDCVFLSPPCKGASGLLSKKLAATTKYQDMNQLALVWVRTMLAAWKDAPPKLVLLENVPRLKTRAGKMLAEVKRLLRKAGYALHEGFHCCGEIGGLAQRRRRYLLVARHAPRCPQLLYQPPKKRVRACGEVLEQLPVPATPDAARFARLHELPKISWLNWVRLALIPAGGDWRDLEGVLAEGQARRELFKRHEVAPWSEPTGVITGEGANAIGAVQDPRVEAFGNVDRVRSWDEPVGTITRSPAPSSGAAVVADPRIEWFGSVLGVTSWGVPSGVVTGASAPTNGRFSVADPRVKTAYDAGYAVLRWEDAARTIAATTSPGCGAYAVADPRVIAMGAVHSPNAHHNKYRVIDWREPAGTVIGATRPGSGAPSVADPRKPPPFLPVIIAKDETWHRPLTTLELAALQGIPHLREGEPLRLAGASQSKWRERIGNAVPVGAARAIAERMLVTLAHSVIGSFSLSGDPVWVVPDGEEIEGVMLERVG